MIQKLLLNIQMIYKMSTKISINTIQKKNDDMIADMINNKKLNPIVTELFIRGRKLNLFL